MLGTGNAISDSIAKKNNSRKQRIGTPGNPENPGINNNSEMDKLIKETARKNMIKGLIDKYYNKIYLNILSAISNKQRESDFYYNYYDFINKKMGHPHLIVNEILYEMCYEFSEYKIYDNQQNVITLKKLFGDSLKWTLYGKNKIKFEW